MNNYYIKYRNSTSEAWTVGRKYRFSSEAIQDAKDYECLVAVCNIDSGQVVWTNEE